MGLFGRESEKDRQRAAAVTSWFHARPGLAVVSLVTGVMSVLDAFTLVIGVIAGGAAIWTGWQGLKQIRTQRDLLGRRLCLSGIVLGVLGLSLSLAMGLWIYPWLKRMQAGG